MKKMILVFLFLSIIFSSIYAQTLQGSFQLLVMDDFKNKKSTSIYQLSVDQQLYTLKMNQKLVKHLHLETGDEVIVDGELLNENYQNIIMVQSITVKKHQ